MKPVFTLHVTKDIFCSSLLEYVWLSCNLPQCYNTSMGACNKIFYLKLLPMYHSAIESSLINLIRIVES